MNKIVIISEAYEPQINGVVTTLRHTKIELENMGYVVKMITPQDFMTIPCPTYPEINLTLNPWKLIKILKDENPDYIHISTEGPLSFFAVMYCEFKNYKFTTSYHTKLPEYIQKRFAWIKEKYTYAYLRRLHKNSQDILVTSKSMKDELTNQGFKNLTVWGRGVDTKLFYFNEPKNDIPILLYVGRISIEKNIETFLTLHIDVPHKKIVVGNGPLLRELKEKYKNSTIEFVGSKSGVELAQYYQNADVFVFPSKTDTFGIVMIEASACGTPIAAYPLTGPIDYIKNNITGFMSDNLSYAVNKCLSINRRECANIASQNSWVKCTEKFQESLVNKI